MAAGVDAAMRDLIGFEAVVMEALTAVRLTGALPALAGALAEALAVALTGALAGAVAAALTGTLTGALTGALVEALVALGFVAITVLAATDGWGSSATSGSSSPTFSSASSRASIASTESSMHIVFNGDLEIMCSAKDSSRVSPGAGLFSGSFAACCSESWLAILAGVRVPMAATNESSSISPNLRGRLDW
jgi:hypothetical protein